MKAMTKEIRVALESCLLCFLLLLFARALSKPNIHLGYSATLSIPLNTAWDSLESFSEGDKPISRLH